MLTDCVLLAHDVSDNHSSCIFYKNVVAVSSCWLFELGFFMLSILLGDLEII